MSYPFGSHNKQLLQSLISSFPKYRDRLSRSETMNTDLSTIDNESLPTIDQLSTAKASVAMLDKLWTQIDVLDDVKLMAEDVRKRGSFFNEEFSTLLAEMKEAQRRLQEVVARHQEANERSRIQRHEQAQEMNRNWGLAEGDAEKETEITKQKMKEFFFLQDTNELVNQQQDFEELNEYVREVQDNLMDLGQRMRNFDEATKKLW